MDYNTENLRAYVPNWNGNRDKDDDSQIVINLAPMTGGELRQAQRAAIGKDGKVNMRAAEKAVEDIITTRVVDIENCFDIIGQPVKNGQDLWERSEQSLIDETYAALTEVSVLSEGLKKS